MQTGYTINAHSPSLNQQTRQFDLSDLNLVQDAQQAQQLADAFAELQNRDAKMGTADWVGRIEFTQVGIETMQGFNGHDHGSDVNTIDLARNVF
jgi:hypothetical protein